VNLFVAGFIGSPAMNFLPAGIEDGRLRTPIGDVAMTDEQRAAVAEHNIGRDVIIGLRPEDFEDLALVHDHREAGGTFTATIDVVESMGSDVYAYFDVEGSGVSSADLQEDTGGDVIGDSEQVVARLDPQTTAREGQPLEIWFDSRKTHIFDPASGTNVTAPSTAPAARSTA
jgi:multiple sugar transport system ATP-binding protein